jgi:DNA-binding CsgD family transcriptional regulator
VGIVPPKDESSGATTNAEALLRTEERESGGRDGSLTPRERQVLELVGVGCLDDQIATRLGIAPTTVAMLLRSSMAKLDARTRVQAVARLRESRANDPRRLTTHPREGGRDVSISVSSSI